MASVSWPFPWPKLFIWRTISNTCQFCTSPSFQIGCGTGFVGIAASKLCKDVQLTLSDRSTDQRLLDLIKRNCELNGVPAERIRIIGLTWGDLEPILDRLRDLDVILASDCFYDPSGKDLGFHGYGDAEGCMRLLPWTWDRIGDRHPTLT